MHIRRYDMYRAWIWQTQLKYLWRWSNLATLQQTNTQTNIFSIITKEKYLVMAFNKAATALFFNFFSLCMAWSLFFATDYEITFWYQESNIPLFRKLVKERCKNKIRHDFQKSLIHLAFRQVWSQNFIRQINLQSSSLFEQQLQRVEDKIFFQ